MKKIAYPVVFLALALSVAHVFAGDADASSLQLSPVKIPKCSKAYVCQDLPYGGRQVGNGAVHANVAQTYDLYLPGNIGEIEPSAPFFLFVHGGAWKRGSKASHAKLFAEMAEEGFVVASMNYVLCNAKHGETHTFAEMLADIDAMVSHLPSLAKAAGISIPRIAIGGSSAGGHLSLLYAYDGANPSVLGLGLKHAVPVACVFTDCGPSDIASPEFVVAGLDWMKGSFENWCVFLGVLAGGPHGQEDVRETAERLAKYSPITLVNEKCPPTICLFGKTGSVKTSGTFKRTKNGQSETYAAFWKLVGSKETPPESVGMDGIVATQNYVTLTNGLTRAGVPFAARLEPYPHCKILFRKPETRPWLYENLRKYLKGNETKSIATAYTPAPSPLMTEWGGKITPENAWREYPRPQMARPEWTCLNGMWRYAVTSVTNTPGRPERWDGEILVPFAIESALSGVGRMLQPDEFLWYTRTLKCIPRPGERILLHFDGVDFRAQVYIGHTEVTDVPHEGAQEPFTLDITPYVKAGENELTVCVWDPTDDFIQSRGKQSLAPKGCFYTRTSGIWQSVWMETVPESYIADYGVTPDLAAGAAVFTVKVAGPRSGDVALEVFDGGRKVGEASFNPDAKGVVKMPADFRRWTPETPHLYTFKARYGRDAVEGYFAMRSFEVKKDAKGVLRFHLNGAPYFAIGTLDQGWWPDGLLTPPSEEAMAHDIMTLKKCGFNMMRKHIKVEPRRYYHLCDTLGLLVFQDMPSSDGFTPDPLGADVLKRYGLYRHELKAMMDNLMKVPSIVAWVPYNEGWSQPGEHLTHATLDFVRRYDPSRPVDGPSGAWDWEGGHLLPKGWAWTNRVETAHRPAGVCEASDMVDMHLYRGPAMFAVNDRRASFLGEFGGLGHPVSNHLWKVTNTWGYGGIKDTSTREGLEKTYLGLMDQLAELAAQGLAGSIYTQTTDVEIEINGLMTYDRKVLKFNPATLSEAHRKVIEAASR